MVRLRQLGDELRKEVQGRLGAASVRHPPAQVPGAAPGTQGARPGGWFPALALASQWPSNRLSHAAQDFSFFPFKRLYWCDIG